MIKVLFCCHGNICRSPMAQFVMQDLVNKQGLSDHFYIDSAATSTEEIGNGVHYGTRGKLKEVGVPLGNHRSTQLKRSDYDQYDYILGMDQWNRKNMLRILREDPKEKVALLLDYSEHPRDIADPWYTGNFDVTYDDILEGCKALLAHILREDKDRLYS
ncbi:MAG: low molecular weight phosphotyrosine protein phosphatase [Lachnospiraceae bacterium]|jgi:protein-tyrosine phosphatase|nr:low molecular weight phosphotyrosine protein phosphatase [Lachnospiraceae bacterium]